MTNQLEKIPDSIIAALLVFLSWAVYYSLGLRYDPTPLNGYFQFIDLVLLQTHFAESLIFYHASPPMLNLISGIGLNLFGEHAVTFFIVLFHLMGVVIAFSFLGLARELTGNRLLALIATTLLVFSPSFVLYENWLMYTFPAVTLITFSAFCLMKVLKHNSVAWLHGFFITLALLVLTRSVFHLGWLVVVVGIGFWLLPGLRQRILVAALAPLLACTLWYGKNQLLFGQFTASTWLGFGLWNVGIAAVERDKLSTHVEDGTISPFALVSRHDMDQVFGDLGIPATGIAVLDQVRNARGYYNFNHRNVPLINDLYTSDALKLIRLYPERYLKSIWLANQQFFTPNSKSPFFYKPSMAVFDRVRPFYDWVIYGAGSQSEIIQIPQYGSDNFIKVRSNPGYTTIFLFICATIFAMVQFITGLRSSQGNRDFILIGYLGFVMLYVYGLATTVELMENYRYRFLVEPIYWVLVITMLRFGWSSLVHLTERPSAVVTGPPQQP